MFPSYRKRSFIMHRKSFIIFIANIIVVVVVVLLLIIINYLFLVGIRYIYTNSLLTKKTNRRQLLC